LARRLSEIQKEKITNLFTSGKSIEELSIAFDCTKSTISRNLKKNLGEKQFKELINELKSKNQSFRSVKKNRYFENENNQNKAVKNEKIYPDISINHNSEEDFSSTNQFIEITPLNYEIENVPQKDLSSVPISDIEFPPSVFMIVDKKTELVVKYLKEYPIWHFLAEDELSRKTIEIYEDQKIAKRFCNKEQKVIKVPNTEVFKIVAPILRFKGISRIVSAEKLIAL
tara:strand:+ start:837 stop:1517 length:681 start_codon:yes stop_codon:yes gene_type:complete